MEAIKLYLEKFKNWRPADAALKEALRAIIQRRFKTAIGNDDIRISGFTIYLKTKTILRSEIMIHREAIMAELEQQLGSQLPKKIV